MAMLYVRPQFGTQEGWQNLTGSPKKYTYNSATHGIHTDRVTLMRFSYVNLPKGSTVSSATLYIPMSVKNDGNQGVTLKPRIHDSPTSAFLDNSREVYTDMTWWNSAASGTVFTWTSGGPAVQVASLPVGPEVSRVLGLSDWPVVGGPMTFALICQGVTNPDNQYMHARDSGFSPLLVIDYTPPSMAGLEYVVNQQENSNMSRTIDFQGNFTMEPYYFNDYFGAYGLPDYSYQTGQTMPTEIGGTGNVLRTTTAANKNPAIFLGSHMLEDGEWYNLSCFVKNQASSATGLVMGLRNERALNTVSSTSVKGDWVRMDISFIAEGNYGALPYIARLSGTQTTGEYFDLTGVQLTKGRRLRPYINGATTKTDMTLGWAGESGTNAFVMAYPPNPTWSTPTVDSKTTVTDTSHPVSWGYLSQNSLTQYSAEVKIGRLR